MKEQLNYFQKMLREAGPAMAASYTLIGAIFLCGGIGYWVDKKYEFTPWGLLIGLLIGIIVGFYNIIKVALKK